MRFNLLTEHYCSFQLTTKETNEEYFDYIFVCVGFSSNPFYPKEIQGIANIKARVLHAHDLRNEFRFVLFQKCLWFELLQINGLQFRSWYLTLVSFRKFQKLIRAVVKRNFNLLNQSAQFLIFYCFSSLCVCIHQLIETRFFADT